MQEKENAASTTELMYDAVNPANLPGRARQGSQHVTVTHDV